MDTAHQQLTRMGIALSGIRWMTLVRVPIPVPSRVGVVVLVKHLSTAGG